MPKTKRVTKLPTFPFLFFLQGCHFGTSLTIEIEKKRIRNQVSLLVLALCICSILNPDFIKFDLINPNLRRHGFKHLKSTACISAYMFIYFLRFSCNFCGGCFETVTVVSSFIKTACEQKSDEDHKILYGI